MQQSNRPLAAARRTLFPAVLTALGVGALIGGASAPRASATPVLQSSQGSQTTPQTPDTPPIEARVWTVHVVVRASRLEPTEIVAAPGQRINIRFDNQGAVAGNITFKVPQGKSLFDQNVLPGQEQTVSMTTPDRPGTYSYSTTVAQTRGRAIRGTLIVTPDAGGSTLAHYGARDVRIVARDYAFNPPSPAASPGEKLRITLLNGGEGPHNIDIVLLGKEVQFDVPLAAGEMRTMTVTIPRQAGTYTFYDPVAGNRDRGMQGSLVVSRAARGTSTASK